MKKNVMCFVSKVTKRKNLSKHFKNIILANDLLWFEEKITIIACFARFAITQWTKIEIYDTVWKWKFTHINFIFIRYTLTHKYLLYRTKCYEHIIFLPYLFSLIFNENFIFIFVWLFFFLKRFIQEGFYLKDTILFLSFYIVFI